MGTDIQAVRGMNDILPTETFLWQNVEASIQEILRSFCFKEIRLPIVEKTDLFKRTIGEATDIVEKEMYTFLDRNDDSLTLRPEGTAGCVRAGIEHGLLYHQTQRLWYCGPYFRHERPQKGRYRQFYQYGAEVFGIATPDIDAELILLSHAIFSRLGLSHAVTLQINSLGSSESRKNYREALVSYLQQHQEALDEDSKRRLHTNPLRILDSKNPHLQTIIQQAPKLIDYLDEESAQHFSQLQKYLDAAGVAFTVNPCLVRGLDYYTKTVFEWVTNELGAQGTVCAGGRYDGLVEQLGGKATPALGFAIGMERLILLMQAVGAISEQAEVDLFVMTDSEDTFQQGLCLSQEIREHFPTLKVLQHTGGGSLKNQFKKADKSGAQYALVIGQDEAANRQFSFKPLRERGEQIAIAQDDAIVFLKKYFS